MLFKVGAVEKVDFERSAVLVLVVEDGAEMKRGCNGWESVSVAGQLCSSATALIGSS